MGKLCAQFSHLVHFVHVLACQEVQSVEVGFVRRYLQGVLCLLHGDDSFVDGTFAFLNPLSHGVQVGGEIYGSREDTLVFLTFGFTIKLLPPFAYVVQFGIVVYEDFNFLTVLVELVTRSCIDGSRIFCKRNIFSTSLFHGNCTCNQFLNVETCYCDGQQAYRSQYGETSAHVIGDDEGFVAFVVGRYAGSALFGIGDGNDNLLCHILAALVFALLFQQTERQGRFSGSTGFGDVDNTEFLVFQVFGKLI